MWSATISISCGTLRLFGMDNRLAAQLQVSADWITFVEEGNPNDYPYDYVAVIDPVQGVYGPEFPDIRNKQLSDVALARRRPSEDHARVRADRRRSRGRLDAVEQWRPTSMARFPAASRSPRYGSRSPIAPRSPTNRSTTWCSTACTPPRTIRRPLTSFPSTPRYRWP